MSRKPSPGKRILGRILLVGGGLVAVVGLGAIGGYALRAVEVLDQSDRSWLFWGLAVLFIGVALLVAGVSLVAVGREMIRPGRGEVEEDGTSRETSWPCGGRGLHPILIPDFARGPPAGPPGAGFREPASGGRGQPLQHPCVGGTARPSCKEGPSPFHRW